MVMKLPLAVASATLPDTNSPAVARARQDANFSTHLRPRHTSVFHDPPERAPARRRTRAPSVRCWWMQQRTEPNPIPDLQEVADISAHIQGYRIHGLHGQRAQSLSPRRNTFHSIRRPAVTAPDAATSRHSESRAARNKGRPKRFSRKEPLYRWLPAFGIQDLILAFRTKHLARPGYPVT